MLKEINDTNFDQLVHESKDPILVDFWAPWCTPCKNLSVLLEEMCHDEKYKNQVLFFKLNVDKNPLISSKYGIRSIPTMIFFKNGKKVDIYVGSASKKYIREKLNVLIK
ncbi:thioredoxin [Blattabacterium cuenoti]|uniref:thioredoxin n=1 Tax=Blattabacterium cuenoti TaxID=1653831 RepID=UPI00163C9082|nr:thioredoxin [Blattabacterium cuenoti]